MHIENAYAYPVTESGIVSFLFLQISEHQAAWLEGHIMEPPTVSPFPVPYQMSSPKRVICMRWLH